MKKRRVRDFLLAGSLILGMMLTGCGMSGQQTEQNGGKEQNKVENEKISVVATIFPQYDFVRQIAGENVKLKMLLKPRLYYDSKSLKFHTYPLALYS